MQSSRSKQLWILKGYLKQHQIPRDLKVRSQQHLPHCNHFCEFALELFEKTWLVVFQRLCLEGLVIDHWFLLLTSCLSWSCSMVAFIVSFARR
eukprot:1370464-Amphidinium_carterae.1